jgi:hypothetical protein
VIQEKDALIVLLDEVGMVVGRAIKNTLNVIVSNDHGIILDDRLANYLIEC